MPGATPHVTTTTTVGSTSAAIFLARVANWDGKSQEIDKELIAAFDAKDYPECIKDLQAQNIEPLSYIDNLDKVNLYWISKHPARFITVEQACILCTTLDTLLLT